MKNFGETVPAMRPERRTAARVQLEEVVARDASRGGWAWPRSVAYAAGRPWRVRPVLTSVVAGAVALSTGAAAYAIAARQPVTNRNSVRCYTIASLSVPNDYDTFAMAWAIPASDPDARTPSGFPPINDPRQLCSDFFRRGFLRVGKTGSQGDPNGRFIYPAPRLVVCVMSDGSAAVIPGKPGTCAALGLPAAGRP